MCNFSCDATENLSHTYSLTFCQIFIQLQVFIHSIRHILARHSTQIIFQKHSRKHYCKLHGRTILYVSVNFLYELYLCVNCQRGKIFLDFHFGLFEKVTKVSYIMKSKKTTKIFNLDLNRYSFLYEKFINKNLCLIS